MNKELAEYINRNASIYYKVLRGAGCAINSRITDYANGTTLLFYYDKQTYIAEYDVNGKCKTVKRNEYK